jgi:hypothetical protein
VKALTKDEPTDQSHGQFEEDHTSQPAAAGRERCGNDIRPASPGKYARGQNSSAASHFDTGRSSGFTGYPLR